MNKFKEVPASKSSLSRRKPLYGVGINDANYITSQIVEGKEVRCPFYVKWKSMIKRCYSAKDLQVNNTYIECFVCNDWLFFSNFKRWMANQDWIGKDLDKDILIQGNKEYSEKACLFVSRSINTLLITSNAARGKFKIGVNLTRSGTKFASHCNSVDNKLVHIGHYNTETEAHEAYKKYKYKLISDIAFQQSEPLRSAMLNHVIPEY